MEFVNLKTEIREKSGKGHARVLRRSASLPGIIYGKGVESVMFTVASSDLENARKASKTRQVFVTLTSDSDKLNGRNAMITELQVDPITNDYKHVDLYEVTSETAVKVKVPVITKGIARGVDMGGLLQVIRRELEIICKPQDVPEYIELDVTKLKWGQSIHVSEVKVEGDIQIPYDVDFTVVTVLTPKGVTGARDEEDEEAAEAAE